MQNKDELVSAIRSWVSLDNEIRAFQKELSARRKQKAQIGKVLVDTMRGHTIDCVEISGGKLLYSKKVTKKPLSRKLIDELIGKYYHDDPSQSEDLKAFLQENRDSVTKEVIIRKDSGVCKPVPATI
jgi:hypothetical protein